MLMEVIVVIAVAVVLIATCGIAMFIASVDVEVGMIATSKKKSATQINSQEWLDTHKAWLDSLPDDTQ